VKLGKPIKAAKIEIARLPVLGMDFQSWAWTAGKVDAKPQTYFDHQFVEENEGVFRSSGQ